MKRTLLRLSRPCNLPVDVDPLGPSLWPVPYSFRTHHHAVAIATGRAVLTGKRHDVYRLSTGRWAVRETPWELPPVKTKPPIVVAATGQAVVL